MVMFNLVIKCHDVARIKHRSVELVVILLTLNTRCDYVIPYSTVSFMSHPIFLLIAEQTTYLEKMYLQ